MVQAKSTDAQIRQVFFQMQRCGSINRYEAAAIGVCALPPRVRELKDLGLCFRHRDEHNVADEHGILHQRIRRYFIDWESMTSEAITLFSGWCYGND
ncbi:helix-turn-helix domain-containing protein [Shewanella algae]|nr:helix-turn-helix domain-containing protein [Shewanella algae]MBC8794339.1 hypothetical protein [Shewanella algae]MBO2579058.1 hypothetical protein [Shewanella algae]MBO2604545.1 hypothetical protein [Shewanella algae]MBO2617190.1 hypothetical protein [Shewanella algae]MBO2684533.1 hypothetical protein [Shewanella algae]